MKTHAALTHKRCKCPTCGEYFSTLSNFDRHRTGKAAERRCVDPASVGLVIGKSGENTFWRQPGKSK